MTVGVTDKQLQEDDAVNQSDQLLAALGLDKEKSYRVVGTTDFRMPQGTNRVGTVLNVPVQRVANYVLSLFGDGAEMVWVEPMVDRDGPWTGGAVIRCDGCDWDATYEDIWRQLEAWGIVDADA